MYIQTIWKCKSLICEEHSKLRFISDWTVTNKAYDQFKSIIFLDKTVLNCDIEEKQMLIDTAVC
jgi:hypothetical protein